MLLLPEKYESKLMLRETQKAIKSSHKTAIDANNNVDDIKEGTISLSDLGSFLFKAGMTLMIGALLLLLT